MNEYKILVTGTMGAGKTTAIAAISEVPPIMTDVQNNDTSNAKLTTTVGSDYGELTLDGGDKLRIYGTLRARALCLYVESAGQRRTGLDYFWWTTRAPDPWPI